MRFLRVFLTLSIILTAYIGDYVVFRSKYSNSLAFRAITDSLVHGSLGFLSSLIFFSHENNFNLQASVVNVTFCTIVSSLIDVDHAFVARSIYLKKVLSINVNGYKSRGRPKKRWIDCVKDVMARKEVSYEMTDMTNLKSRGIFHCTTFWLLLTSIVLLYSYIEKKLDLYLLSFMLILAYSSHHLRDGNRRGLWFYPFGSSPPIEKNLYLFLLAVLPHVIAWVYHMCKGSFTKTFTVDYNLVV